MAGDRTSCAVPFCPRTSRSFPVGWWWVCGTHWRGVDRRLKRIRTKARRGNWGGRYNTLIALIDRRMLKQAIERAALNG